MAKDWKRDKAKTDWVTPLSQRWVMHHFPSKHIRVASFDDDMRLGQDIQAHGADFGVGQRVYNWDYWGERYFDTVTIRCGRPLSENDTEWPKIMRGWINAGIFVWVSHEHRRVKRWVLMEFTPLRLKLLKDNEHLFVRKPTTVGDAEFYRISTAWLHKNHAIDAVWDRRVARTIDPDDERRTQGWKPVGKHLFDFVDCTEQPDLFAAL